MAKLTDRACANTKPQPDRDVLLGDGDGLYLRIRPGGARVWVVDYVVKGSRKKASIGNFDSKGGNSQTIESLLADGVLSPAQARLVASEWKKCAGWESTQLRKEPRKWLRKRPESNHLGK